ncbi:centriolar coiled-coil protein of 110 kDa [Anopheles ziemanni]|uniref:centriolar coiled-coil protein of 110 kDa n=1 Tax=Anopheles coustani TaxID=139045 RepID=UPI0026592738|nr:centriolar coiled-coil protein of 110 kDa [Anopheles coustani]XP_058168904.1 centriolar coiled-coil protein of 110 kDa [Anopheles ziemanni]
MAKSFVSVFKLDGVPILPPVMNDDVRAMVAIYRQKAIEIEKRLRERKQDSTESVAEKCIESWKQSSDPVVEASKMTQTFPAIEAAADSENRSSIEKSFSLETTSASSKNTTIEYEELPDSSVSLQRELSRTLTPAKQTSVCHVHSPVGITSAAPHHVPKESISKEMAHEAVESQMAKMGTLLPTMTSKTDLPSWQTSTRTVTPTSDESLPWLPLVRSNTYNLEKPTIDLQSLPPPNHSTPVDPNKNISGISLTRSVSQPAPPKPKAHIGNETVNMRKKETALALNNNLTSDKQKATVPSSCGKVRSKRISSARTVSNCSADSANDRSFESVANVLTSHEQRMVELLRRQEEERLLLEKSFRAKTQELVALCAKSLTTEVPDSNVPLAKTPEFDPASSVSQLSLCDVSYDSCTDTDDAAYQTCHANGTSEENVADIENILNNSLAKPFSDRAFVGAKANPCDVNRTKDVNGNEQIALLPQRMYQLQQHRAATIINAHVRGFLTRRLLQTEEVQTIKQTIIDILCFIMQSRSRGPSATDGSVRRSAGKHITFCLDRLHDIFVNYSPAQRIQMIRRDRYLKNKTVGPK